MIETVFLKIVNMSITASYLVFAISVARLLLKKAPKFINVILWGLVAARLVCPFYIESIFSLIPSTQTVPQDIVYSKTPQIYSGISPVNTVVNNVIMPRFYPNAADSVNPLQIVSFIACIIWITGVAVMLFYAAVSYFRIYFKVREAIKVKENIYECDCIDSPFILGLIKPRIYLPYNMVEADKEYVIMHEKAHLKRRDYIWKPLGFLLLTVYWFNPVLWVAYILLCRDIELACDEKVIKAIGEQGKKFYSNALINCSCTRKIITACPVAFGETGVKGRIKSVLNYKKPSFWVVIFAIVLSVIIAVSFMTNPTGVQITAIDDFGFHNDMFDGTKEITVLIGEKQYFTDYEQDINEILEKLEKTRVRKDEISKSRAEDRERTNSIAFNNYTLYFNDKFNEVWCLDSVKPSFSYKILNENVVKSVFKLIENSESNRVNQNLVVTNINTGSNYDGLLISVQNISLDVKEPYIELSVKNESESRYSVGMKSDLYYDKHGEYETCSTFKYTKNRKRSVSATAWILLPDKDNSYTKKHSLKNDDLSKEGKYRLETEYGWVEFELERPNDDTNDARFKNLKEKYPEFFNLDTSTGLELYVSEFAEDNYKCQLFSADDYNFAHNNYDINTEQGATLQEMKAILSSYDISSDKLYVIPYRNPLSSYYYTIDSEYCEKLKVLFGSTAADVYKPNENSVTIASSSDLNFRGKIIKIYDNGVLLVEPFSDEEEYTVCDKYAVTVEAIKNYGSTSLKEGEEIRIVYDGFIKETYPAQINAEAVFMLNENQ